jgi:hypothetical protein
MSQLVGSVFRPSKTVTGKQNATIKSSQWYYTDHFAQDALSRLCNTINTRFATCRLCVDQEPPTQDHFFSVMQSVLIERTRQCLPDTNILHSY